MGQFEITPEDYQQYEAAPKPKKIKDAVPVFNAEVDTVVYVRCTGWTTHYNSMGFPYKQCDINTGYFKGNPTH
jgi:hypothetical protein